MPVRPGASKRASSKRPKSLRFSGRLLGLLLTAAAGVGVAAVILQAQYTISLQSPVRIRFQFPFVVAPKTSPEEALEAQNDQFGHRLTAYQQYACNKFGRDCRIALAVQRAENPRGACEIYHYNNDGTLDWGYFQINTVHLKRAGVNLETYWIAKPISTSHTNSTRSAASSRGALLIAGLTGSICAASEPTSIRRSHRPALPACD